MTKTKQTPRGSSSSHRPRGMATARFTQSATVQPEDTAAGDESHDSQDWLDFDNPQGEAATQGKGEASKSPGKSGTKPAQAEGEAPAPPEENPPAPTPSDLKPGTRKDPTDTPAVDPTQAPKQDPTQATTQGPDQETPPNLTVYVKNYQKAGKTWLDTVLENKEKVYDTLFDKLLRLGDPHIDRFPLADKQTVMKCIKDRTGRFLSKDAFVVYVEKDDPPEKPKIKL